MAPQALRAICAVFHLRPPQTSRTGLALHSMGPPSLRPPIPCGYCRGVGSQGATTPNRSPWTASNLDRVARMSLTPITASRLALRFLRQEVGNLGWSANSPWRRNYDKLRARRCEAIQGRGLNDALGILPESETLRKTNAAPPPPPPLPPLLRFETTITSVLLLSQRHLSVGTMNVRAIVRGRALVVGW